MKENYYRAEQYVWLKPAQCKKLPLISNKRKDNKLRKYNFNPAPYLLNLAISWNLIESKGEWKRGIRSRVSTSSKCNPYREEPCCLTFSEINAFNFYVNSQSNKKASEIEKGENLFRDKGV